jgi:hypothetical protein
MLPGIYSFTLHQGATFHRTIQPEGPSGPFDLSDFTARMQIRKSKSSTDTILNLTEGDGITTGTDSIDIDIADEVTQDLKFSAAYYDLELVHLSGWVARLLEGRVTLSREVTR